MTHGELFAGVDGFALGFDRVGIETLFAVEINPKCQSVSRRHRPDIVRVSDVCEAGAHNLPRVDIITFGSPCQDLSIAGKKAGLVGSRSSLFYEGIRIIRELQPAVAIWENVEHALRSNAGRDFAAVLSSFRDIGARDIAWRVLDAQYFGVPQRRKRLFVVADFRGERAGQILFEPERMSRDPKTGRAKGKDIARAVKTGSAICMRQREGKPGGGKGALLSENSLTLGCSNDQVLFCLDSELNPYSDMAGTLMKGSPTGGGGSSQ